MDNKKGIIRTEWCPPDYKGEEVFGVFYRHHHIENYENPMDVYLRKVNKNGNT